MPCGRTDLWLTAHLTYGIGHLVGYSQSLAHILPMYRGCLAVGLMRLGESPSVRLPFLPITFRSWCVEVSLCLVNLFLKDAVLIVRTPPLIPPCTDLNDAVCLELGNVPPHGSFGAACTHG